MLGVTDALRATGGSATIEELDEKVIELKGLSEGATPTDRSRVHQPQDEDEHDPFASFGAGPH